MEGDRIEAGGGRVRVPDSGPAARLIEEPLPRRRRGWGLEIGGKFMTFTAIGMYLEESIGVLSGKWKGKAADELADDSDKLVESACCDQTRRAPKPHMYSMCTPIWAESVQGVRP